MGRYDFNGLEPKQSTRFPEWGIASVLEAPPLTIIVLQILAMAGPGAWSIDARLFGRKRIDVPERSWRFFSPKGV
jgi:hypothetical protein